MSSDLVKQINGQSFDAEVLNSGLPVLVDFWADWCQPCRMLAPAVDALAADYEGRVSVCKLNVDEDGPIAAQYGVMSIPTLILFKDGQPAERLVGLRPKEAIAEVIDGLI